MKTATRERPILFSSPMVKAIMEGRKTQTRRVCKLRDPSETYSERDDDGWPWSADHYGDWHRDDCPFGGVGDVLWIKETYALVRPWTDPDTGYVDDVEEWAGPLPKSLPDGWRIWYAADSDDITHHPDDRLVKRWRPSIHMPRWASRLTLEVTGVRVERVREISEADAWAEGLWRVGDDLVTPGPVHVCEEPRPRPGMAYAVGGGGRYGYAGPPVQAFAVAWDNLVNPREYYPCDAPNGWHADPWVWAIEFRRIDT